MSPTSRLTAGSPARTPMPSQLWLLRMHCAVHAKVFTQSNTPASSRKASAHCLPVIASLQGTHCVRGGSTQQRTQPAVHDIVSAAAAAAPICSTANTTTNPQNVHLHCAVLAQTDRQLFCRPLREPHTSNHLAASHKNGDQTASMQIQHTAGAIAAANCILLV